MQLLRLANAQNSKATDLTTNRTHEQEISDGERFSFGENWARFLHIIDEQRIQEAEVSLKTKLNVDHLHGKAFLDIGCGSGLFSLAARRLGAKVLSFDYDPQSVACAEELNRLMQKPAAAHQPDARRIFTG